jgi:hypothetical protein
MKRLAVLLVLAACTDRVSPTVDPAAVPGELTISLRAAAPAVGAVRFVVRGGDVAQVNPATPDLTVFSTIDGDGITVIVIGERLEGPLVRLRVPDVRKPGSYRIEILEIVDTGNQNLPVGASYGLVLREEVS